MAWYNRVKTFEDKLESFRIDFDKLEIDVDNWENIRKGSNYQLKELNDKIVQFKNDLLMNHVYTFESNTTLFDVANEASKIIAKKASIKKGMFWLLLFLISLWRLVFELWFLKILKKSLLDMEVLKFLI